MSDSNASGRPIDEEEASGHLVFVEAALYAPGPAERDAELGRAFVEYGLAFLTTLNQIRELSKASGGEDPRWSQLWDSGIQQLGRWLQGSSFTNRADEGERRVVAAHQLLDGFDGQFILVRQVAEALVGLPEGHPGRDFERARALLEAYLAQPEGTTDADTRLRVLSTYLFHFAASDEVDGVDGRATALLAEAEPDAVEAHHRAAVHRAMLEAIRCRDAGDAESRRRWYEWAAPHRDAIAGSHGVASLAAAAVTAEEQGDFGTAAALYDAIRAHPDASPDVVRLAGVHGGRSHWAVGDARGTVELLAPMLAMLAQRYGEAVNPDAIESARSELASAGEVLILALVSLERWREALHALDQLRSTRFRFRQALRDTAAGRRLLELEQLVLDAERGVPVELPEALVDRRDRLAGGVSTLATLREAYRADRPEVDPGLVSGAPISEWSSVLHPDEVAVVLGLTYEGTLVAVVEPRRGDEPAAAMFDRDLSRRAWAETLAGNATDGWLYALGAPEADLDRAAALDAVIKAADDAIAKRVVELLHGRVPARLCVIPHGLLHFVPFQALPTFEGSVVTTSPSAAQLLRERRGPVRALRGAAVVVANPTLDLPLSVSEVASVRHFAEAKGLSFAVVPGREATEEAVTATARGACLLHLTGHGQSDLDAPEESSLLLAPPASLEGDPFPEWLAAAGHWIAQDEENRRADVAGVGVLSERRLLDGAWIERSMVLPGRCTIWAFEQDGITRTLAERWSAGDLLVEDALTGCSLAVLSACGSGRSENVEADEYSGLPAALTLAGVGTVVATQWPIDEGVAAVTVELLYRELACASQDIDVAAVVARVRSRLRIMSKQEAADIVEKLRADVRGPARFGLEAYARRLRRGAPRPFSRPWDWAAFVVAGQARLRVGSPA